MVASFLTCSAVGSAETVARLTAEFIERTAADELMIATQIFEHEKRLRSYEILAQACK